MSCIYIYYIYYIYLWVAVNWLGKPVMPLLAISKRLVRWSGQKPKKKKKVEVEMYLTPSSEHTTIPKRFHKY